MLRRIAVQALGRIGDPRVTDPIRELMWDHDLAVATAAGDALDALQGGEEGADPWK